MLQRAELPSRKPRPTERARRHPGPWIALFAAALAIRVLGAWLTAGPVLPAEAVDYDAVAARLAQGAGFSLESPAGPRPTALVPPVGPWLTSLVYRVAGHRPLAAILFQCAIGALVPLLLAGFASSTFGGTVGRAAGWLAALDPLLVLFAGRLGPETLFTALLLAAITGSAAWVKTPRPARALGVGLLWGIASLTWPVALLLPAVIAAWAWVPLGLSVPTRERLRHVVLLLLGLTLAVGPWTIRNALALHAFVPITTGSGLALLAGNNPLVWSAPLDTPARVADAFRVWSWVWSLVTWPLAAWGLFRTLRGPRRLYQSLGFMVVLYFLAAAVVFSGGLRMRVPAEPMLVLFAAVGFEDARRRARMRARALRVIGGSR